MSDNVNTSPLGIERTERIAGDEAINNKLDIVTAELQNTQTSVTTEVVHRSEGDLVVQRILEGYIKDLLDGKADDFERYIEFQNSQNLNYADVRNFVSGIRTSLADEIRNLSNKLMDNLQANDARYNKLVSDVGRYREILSDITLDSNQITLDNGELRAGAWTILSQAREWDLEIISRLNGLTASVGDSLKDAVEELQNQLPSTEATISKAIEELSKSPIIKNLTDLLNQSIANDTAYANEMVDQARQHARDMLQLAEDLRAEAQARAASVEAFVEGEVTTRIQEINKEVSARKEAINLLTEDMLERADEDKAAFQADMAVLVGRITSAEDGLSTEIQHRKDGDSSTLTELRTYKISNDNVITGMSASLLNNINSTDANSALITGLTSRMNTAEAGIASATTTAADALTKATTSVDANSALSTRVDALSATLTELEGSSVDATAFNTLKAEVTNTKGEVASLVEDVSSLESNYTTVSNDLAAQGAAISTLNLKMTDTEGKVSQSANDITLLKTDISSINSSLATKADSQALSQLSSDVSELDGKYTTQAGLVTDLRGSLDTTNLNVSNAASAAQNALNTAGSKGKVIFGSDQPGVEERLSQNLWIDTTGGSNTPKRWNGSAWVVVTDKVAIDAANAVSALNNVVNTKADVTALNSLTTKVDDEAGKTTANTNSITTLNSDIVKISNDLATKASASALNDIYTKQQTDDKAQQIAAGEVAKYDASLSIGLDNLLPTQIELWEDGFWNVANGAATPYSTLSRTKAHVKIPVIAGEQYSLQSNTRTLLVFFSAGNTPTGYHDSGSIVPPTTAQVITVPANTTYARAILFATSGALVKPVPFDQAALTALQGLLVKGKHTRLIWHPSALATAIQNTNAEVSRVDDRVTTESNRITSLTGRVSTVEGAVSTKADASALNSLTTRVVTEEGKSTSQGSAITSLQNTINHATTGLSTKASSAALTAVDNKVTSVDGRVTATNSSVTNLTGRVSTVEGGLTTKADVSAVNALTTRVGNVENGIASQANQLTSLSAKLNERKIYQLYSGGLAAATGGMGWLKGFDPNSYYDIGRSYGLVVFNGDGSIQSVNSYDVYGGHAQSFIEAVAAVPIGTYVAVLTSDEPSNNKEYIKATLKSLGGSDAIDQVVHRGAYLLVGRKGLPTGQAIEKISNTKSFGVDYLLEMYNGVPIGLGGSSPQSDIVSNMRTEVSNIGGNITSLSETVTQHTASLANLSLGGFNLLYNGDFSTNSYDGWNFAAHITPAQTIAVLNRNGGLLSEWALNADPSKTLVINTVGNFPVDGHQYIDVFQKIAVSGDSFYQLSAYVAPHRSKAIVYATFLNHFGEIIGYSTVGIEPNSVCSQPVEGSLGGKLLQNYRRIHINIKTPSDTAYLYFNIRFVSFAGAYLFMTRTMCCQVSALNAPLMPWNEGSSAAANVSSTSLAKVTEIDGRVSSLAQQTTTLSTTVDQNTSKLVIQGNSLDGIKAEYFIKTDVNGLVAGYGLVNGGTTSAFAVSAEAFFVGSPNNSKKPFMVLASTQTVNGVAYPAGTWIDTALIANATIGSAHIANASINDAHIVSLNASKITAGIIDADRIGANSISAEKLMVGDATNLWGNQHFTQVNPYPISGNGRTRWVTDVSELKGNGIQMWGRDHIAPYSTKIPLKAGDTFVIEYIAGRNGGPDKPLNVGLWTYNINGNGGNAPWQHGQAEQIATLGNGWFRWRRVFVVTNAGHTLPVAYGVLYFQIEQAAEEPNPAYWTVGDVTVRKGVGGELIVNGSVTADKLSASAIETIALKAQNVTVLKDTSKPDGTRLVMLNGLITVYDDNNKVRVKLGLW